jgi:glycosyltransferase involved in cell wall biosynthesis
MLFLPQDGGVPENVAQLALRLGAYDWEVEVAGPAEAANYKRLEAAGIPVHRIECLRPGYTNVSDHARALTTVIRVLRRGRFGLVHCHGGKAGALGRLAAGILRLPSVYSPHCFDFVGDVSPARRRTALAIERALGRLGAVIVCACEDERRRALEHRIAPPERLRVVYHGTEPCDARTDPDAALLRMRDGGPLAGAVAGLRQQKRLDVLIDAAPRVFARVPAARIAIVGNGPLRAQLEKRAAAHGLDHDERFAFFPFTPPSARYLRALDVYVLPSGWESMPIGALEALACGVPQVATDVAGTGEAVAPDTGRLVPPGDPEALADAIVWLLSDDMRRAKLAEASRVRHAERFAVDRMVAETAAAYAAARASA